MKRDWHTIYQSCGAYHTLLYGRIQLPSGTAPLKQTPSEYLSSGRFFCSIEMHEGDEMFNHVTSVLGDDVLMYASDYPHSECHFPDSIDHVLSWSSLKPAAQHKLLWDNAVRFYKQT